MGTTRLARLDGLRGVAAAGVLVYHSANWSGLATTPAWGLGWVFRSGWTFVDLFFVLSGYVFAHVYGAQGQLRGPGATTAFWVARVARLWPLHLVTLALFAIFGWGGANNAAHLMLHLFMLQGFDLAAIPCFNAVTWSLTIEMLCYALFCLSARAGDRALWWMTALAVLGGGGFLALLGHADGGPWFAEIIPRGLFGFFTGQALWRYRDLCARIPLVTLWGALALGMWLDQGRISTLVPLGLLTWPAAVLLALRMPVMESRPFHWLGQRSFGIYMLHMLAIPVVHTLWPPAGLRGAAIVWSQLAIIALTLLAAEAAFWGVEMPGRRIIRASLATQSHRQGRAQGHVRA